MAAIAVVFLTAGCEGGTTQPTAAKPRAPDSRMVAYAVCMRSHGLPGFPDPTVSANGGEQFRFSPASGANPESPAFSGAQRHCQHLLPYGTPRRPVAPEKRQQFVQYAGCMRAHGVPAFPDPRFGSATVRESKLGSVRRRQSSFSPVAGTRPSGNTRIRSAPGASESLQPSKHRTAEIDTLVSIGRSVAMIDCSRRRPAGQTSPMSPPQWACAQPSPCGRPLPRISPIRRAGVDWRHVRNAGGSRSSRRPWPRDG